MIVVRAPQVSVNDEHVLLVEWLKSEGDAIHAGETVGRLETSKALVDLVAEGEGCFRSVAMPGDSVPVEGVLYVLTETREEPLDELLAGEEQARAAETPSGKEERGWTKKAEMLATRHGINIADIPAVGIVREADVEQFLKAGGVAGPVHDLIDDVYRTNRAEKVLVIGGGRGAVQVMDVLWRSAKQRPVAILDDNPSSLGKVVMGVKIIGKTGLILELLKDGIFDAAVIAFSNALEARARIFGDLSSQGVPFTNVIDPSVSIHSNVSMGTGNVIMANCRIGACAEIGDDNFLSAFVNIEHHNVLGSHCTFGPGVLTSSRVNLGSRTRFGTGVFVEPGVRIGDDCVVASGSIITSHIPARSLVKARVETVVRPR